MRLCRARAGQGFALLVVMVVILVLGILAAGFAYSMKIETRLARNVSYEADLLWLGRSGVELARYVLGQQLTIPFEGNFDALNQKWAGGPGGTNDQLADISLQHNELGPGRFSVRLVDLERKVNLNFANRPMLERAFELMGFNTLDVASVVDAIEDWRDRDPDPRLNGAESDYYLGLKPRYLAKDGPFDDLSELLLVRGVTPELYWGATGGASVPAPLAPRSLSLSGLGWNDQPGPPPFGLADVFNTLGRLQVNINTASATVLQLLPGVDEDMALSIIQLRAGPDGADGTEDDTPFHNAGELVNVRGMPPQFVQQLQRYCGVRSFTFEAHVDVQMGAYRRHFVALLFRNGPRDVQVLSAYWE
jgi:general secretion pathway protein K